MSGTGPEARGRTTSAALVAVLLAAGCSTGPFGTPDVLERTPPPPIPEITGPPRVYVAYPDSLQRIAVSDSNFLFGTVGTGDASLTVNGRPVRVKPNGAFLAWLPVPGPVRGDTAVYRLVARAGGRVDSALHRILVPRRPPTAGAWLDSASVARLPERWALPGEEVVLAIAGTPGLEARASAGDVRVPLREVAEGRYEARVPARRLAGARSGRAAPAPWPGPRRALAVPELAPADSLTVRFAATDGEDTVRVEAALPFRLLDEGSLPRATLVEEPHPVHGLAGSVAARPTPTGSYAWLFPSGSGGRVDGRIGARVRIRTGSGQAAWVDAGDVRMEAAGEPAAAEVEAGVGRVSVEPWDDRVRVRIPVDRRTPAHVRMAGPHTLELVVHGGLAETGRMVYGGAGGFLASLDWRQLPGPRWVLRVETGGPVWGWDLLWEGVRAAVPAGEASGGHPASAAPPLPVDEGPPPPAEAAGTLVLDVRRPRWGDPDRPLRGLRVAVDPGHPPVGAEGPTGLTEADANLAVARRLAERLEAAGADPILVRDDTAAVGLYERRRRARAGGADLLVSIHNNALPDGVRPFDRAGTSTYYFHPHALPLARDVQRGMLAAMGLRDLGVRWGNLALPRESWMPSVLTEGAFMMIPRHEAALRTEAFRDAYARGVIAGIRAFVERIAAEAPSLRL